jgi:hypothetical protein
MHCGAEVTESSTNKKHHLYLWPNLWMLAEFEKTQVVNVSN